MRIYELMRDVETLQEKVEYLEAHQLTGVVESLQQRVDNLNRTQAPAAQSVPANLNDRIKAIEYKTSNLERMIGRPPVSEQSGRAEAFDDIWKEIKDIKNRLRNGKL